MNSLRNGRARALFTCAASTLVLSALLSAGMAGAAAAQDAPAATDEKTTEVEKVVVTCEVVEDDVAPTLVLRETKKKKSA